MVFTPVVVSSITAQNLCVLYAFIHIYAVYIYIFHKMSILTDDNLTQELSCLSKEKWIVCICMNE